MSITTITPQQLFKVIESGKEVDLIDVRTPAEYREIHISYARNQPLDRLDVDQLVSRYVNRVEPLYVVCHSGMRAGQACEKLLREGLDNVVSVEGGTKAWDAAGLPVVRGKGMISLQRQVQMAAGFLVFVGTVLGYFVHPYFLGIPAFIGAGVMTSGITGSCAMGMMLAKMPWNQVADESESPAKVSAVGSCCEPQSTTACGQSRKAS
jgi:rhodanese-related sulfurtransferase